MRFDRRLLYFFVRDALRGYSERFRITDRGNPTLFTLNGKRYAICASYIHDSGGNRPNDEEVRIQISRPQIDQQILLRDKRVRTAFLGFFTDGRTFVSWDPNHVFSLQAETRVSVYARSWQPKEVASNHASVHQFRAHHLQDTSFAIALPTYALGFYLENIRQFHSLRSRSAVEELMERHRSLLARDSIGSISSLDLTDGSRRRKFRYTRASYPRDPHFREMVLDAYRSTCCVCGRQLGIIEAAHVVPHSEPRSPNTVNNGLALCVEHHKLYDDGLLLPGPKRKLVYNQARGNYLEQTNRGKGLEEIAALNGESYRHPRNREHRPKDRYLDRGLKIRLAG